MDKRNLTIYVMAHNRPDMLRETIKALQEQTFNDFTLVVSDNSDNNNVKDMLIEERLIDTVDYRYRNGSENHFDLIINEVTSRYFMMLHDDDILLPDMVSRLYSKILEGNFAAVGCNAYKIWEKRENIFGKMLDSDQDITIHSIDEMFLHYFGGCGVAAFPSYIYDKTRIRGMHFVWDAGPYSDVTWLAKLTEKGNLYWIVEPLMLYRKHAGQDSYNQYPKATRQLLNFFLKHSHDTEVRCKIKKEMRDSYKEGLINRITSMKIREDYLAHKVERFSEKYDHIYIYGCGDIGRRCLVNLQNHGIYPTGFFVSSKKDIPDFMYGYPVREYSDEILQKENACVVIGLGKSIRKEIMSYPSIKKQISRFLIYSKFAD